MFAPEVLHSVHCKALTFILHSFQFRFFASVSTMSSLEEPLGVDKLPSMSTVDRIQRFSSGACRPRAEDVGMGNCWIEGRSCSSSNSCKWVKFHIFVLFVLTVPNHLCCLNLHHTIPFSPNTHKIDVWMYVLHCFLS